MKRGIKFENKFGPASILAALAFLASLFQGAAVYYRVPTDVSEMAMDIKSIRSTVTNIDKRLVRVETQNEEARRKNERAEF